MVYKLTALKHFLKDNYMDKNYLKHLSISRDM